jgi:hypothetical protein
MRRLDFLAFLSWLFCELLLVTLTASAIVTTGATDLQSLFAESSQPANWLVCAGIITTCIALTMVPSNQLQVCVIACSSLFPPSPPPSPPSLALALSLALSLSLPVLMWSGWIQGADICTSIALNDDGSALLFLFGDTLVGRFHPNGTRDIDSMPRNSVGLVFQHGGRPRCVCTCSLVLHVIVTVRLCIRACVSWRGFGCLCAAFFRTRLLFRMSVSRLVQLTRRPVDAALHCFTALHYHTLGDSLPAIPRTRDFSHRQIWPNGTSPIVARLQRQLHVSCW